jgi:hypothetical protein
MGSYAPLHTWLMGQPAIINNIQATFVLIEGTLGFILPVTARQKSQWWENNATRRVQARAWLDAGLLTQNVNLQNQTLTFVRSNLN